MTNMMRGMTAMLVLAACAPAAGQTTATAVTVPVTQKEPFTLHFRLGNGGEGGFGGASVDAVVGFDDGFDFFHVNVLICLGKSYNKNRGFPIPTNDIR